ncbi:MAG TPA: right-handed parallel beta-helix repeat-containing protein [Actinomycetota bacterium]|nr:right-handed parallel beta-helix repeat-containing protein [Actinomycetota bacterium]
MPARSRRMARALLTSAVSCMVVVLAATTASAHNERPTDSPARPGSVPDASRIAHQHPVLDVCKTKVGGSWECGFHDIQAAVDAAPDGALIRIWPGLYKELPSRRVPSDLPFDGPHETYTFQFQKRHPNVVNLVAIVGKKNITLLGMGRKPTDVVVDVGFAKHVGIRADRADGFIIKNVSVWHAVEHGVYILDQSGYRIDHVVSGFSGEYSFLTFATDHGLYIHCEATGAGDGGIYPGGQADTPGRVSTEVSHCISHHNVLGYSGTQGDHVWVHDTKFFDNASGLVSDSETDHPNYPENNLMLEDNEFFDNNYNPYSPDADVMITEFDEAGTGFTGNLIPVGTGIFLASGNDNLVQNNRIWGHANYGVWLGSGQGLVVGPTSDPAKMPFMSSGNRFLGNRMYPPGGVSGSVNRIDFTWDGVGLDNCWEGNTRSADGDPVTTDNVMLPPCHLLPEVITAPPPVWVPNPFNILAQLGIAKLNGRPMCAVLQLQPCVYGAGPDPRHARNTKEGQRVEWPPPPTCGPSTCEEVLARRYG